MPFNLKLIYLSQMVKIGLDIKEEFLNALRSNPATIKRVIKLFD